MRRTSSALTIVAALALQVLYSPAQADEIRHTTFPATLVGTWAEKADQCAAKDKSVVIEAAQYGDGSGTCAVRWIVETAAAHGTNYAVHALCTSAKDAKKTQVVNIIVRPQPDGRAVMGRSFADLKTYQRCP